MCIVCKPVSPCPECAERRLRMAARRGVSVFGKLTSDGGGQARERAGHTEEQQEAKQPGETNERRAAVVSRVSVEEAKQAEANDEGDDDEAAASVPRLCRLLEESLAAAKSPRLLRCSRLLVPIGLVRRAARSLLAASAAEPCGLQGALVRIAVSPSMTAAATSAASSRRHGDDGYWEEDDDDNDDDDDEPESDGDDDNDDDEMGKRKAAPAAVTWELPRPREPLPPAPADGASASLGDGGFVDGDASAPAAKPGPFADCGFCESGVFGLSDDDDCADDNNVAEEPAAAAAATAQVEPTFRLTLELSEEGAGLAERGLAGLRSLLAPGAAGSRGSVRLAGAFTVRKQRLYGHGKKRRRQLAAEE